MQTALANKNGELVLPVLISGTFDHPQFAPDMEQVAHMKLENMLPSFGNPGQLSSGILGAITGQGSQNGQQGGLGGIVGAITGQGQQQQPQQNQQGQPAVGSKPKQPNPQDQVQDLVNGILGGQKKKEPK